VFGSYAQSGDKIRLSYKTPACNSRRMTPEPNWRDRARAVEYWLAAAIVAGSFVAGLVSAVRYLTGW